MSYFCVTLNSGELPQHNLCLFSVKETSVSQSVNIFVCVLIWALDLLLKHVGAYGWGKYATNKIDS